MRDDPKWHSGVTSWAKGNPNKAAFLVSMAGVGWLLNQRPEIIAALIATGTFQEMPSGWMVLSISLMGAAILHLYRKLEVCERECSFDRERIHTLERSQEDLIERLFDGAPLDRRQADHPVEKDRRRR